MYLEDLRLKTAMELLFKEQLSVKETASLCGYMMSIIFAAFSGNATGFHRENTGRRISSNL
jgi:transcriptional regulator GlxA family with amidase domain